MEFDRAVTFSEKKNGVLPPRALNVLCHLLQFKLLIISQASNTPTQLSQLCGNISTTLPRERRSRRRYSM